jgi:hypothetical protein
MKDTKEFKMNKNLLVFIIPFCSIIICGEISAQNKKQSGENDCLCSSPRDTVTKNIKTDFGAYGNNRHDDTFAFMNASDWLNKNSGKGAVIKLVIPRGTYLVGMQLAAGEKIVNPLNKAQSFSNATKITRLGIHIINLKNAKNILITGTKGTVIKYKNNLLFGGYDAQLKKVTYIPNDTICSTTKNSSCFASIGIFITMTDCSCITIEQLTLNGNNTAFALGGHYGECNGYELEHDGIDIFGSDHITIKNISCSNFGRDGIMSAISKGNPDCIRLINVISEKNSRQGYSFTGGNNVIAENCSFSKTGAVFANNPASGVDIEPESGGVCSNSIFNNCKFIDNAFTGMISDNHFPDVKEITFNDCEFSAFQPSSWSLWPKRMIHTEFNNCIIRGKFTHVTGIDSLDHMKFNKCVITDWNNDKKISGEEQYLMDFGSEGLQDNHFYEFNYCDFQIHKSLTIYTVEVTGSNSHRVFDHNKWTFYVNDLQKIIPHFPDTPGKGYLGRFVNCTIKSNTFNETAPTQIKKNLYFLEMDSSTNDSDCLNTFAPQNGKKQKLYSRVQNNPDWRYCYRFFLNDF